VRLVALVLTLASCVDDDVPTQALVFVFADPGVRAEADVIRVEVLGEGEQVFLEEVSVDRSVAQLARIPVLPRNGDPTRTYEVVVELLEGDEVVATLRVGGGYEANALREIRAWFDLSDACADVDCGPGRTCHDGRCLGACFDFSESRLPTCGACEQCVRGACSPVADGTECGCGDECEAGSCDVARSIRNVALGENVTCASVGVPLHCWGHNWACRLGLPCGGGGAVGGVDVPTEIARVEMQPGDPGLRLQYAEAPGLGADHGCTTWVPREGETRRTCWGWGGGGALGLGEFSDRTEPRDAPVEDPVELGIRSGRFHSCGLSNAGDVYCWGSNAHGAAGQDDAVTQLDTPTRVEGLPPIRELALGWAVSCALGEGRIYCWGDNREGELGDGSGDVPRHEPACVVDAEGECLEGFLAIGGKRKTICGLREVEGAPSGTGELWCWGANPDLVFTTGAEQMRRPVLLKPGWLWSRVSASESNLCAIRVAGPADPAEVDRGLYCWGGNGTGELGVGARVRRDAPTRVQVERGDRWVEVDLGPGYTCGVREEGTLWCWGSNDGSSTGVPDRGAGRLGLGLGWDPGPNGGGASEAQERARTDLLLPRRVCP